MNGIEKDLKGRARVVRLNLLSKPGREIARAYAVNAVPAMIIFDAAGRVLYRHEGLPDRKSIVQEVTRLGG